MKVFEYPDENKKKRRAADVESVLADMANYEALHGSSQRKIEDNWYSLKEDLISALQQDRKQKQAAEEQID